MPRHLVANSALFVELGRGRGSGGQRGGRWSWLVSGAGALRLQYGCAAPLLIVVHPPQSHTTIITC